MKLTPELIASSPSYLNALKDRQLDLRGAHLNRTFYVLKKTLGAKIVD